MQRLVIPPGQGDVVPPPPRQVQRLHEALQTWGYTADDAAVIWAWRQHSARKGAAWLVVDEWGVDHYHTLAQYLVPA